MGFRDSWIDLFHRAATGTKKTRSLLTPIGVTVFGVFTASFVYAAVGLAVTAWSVFHFLKVKGTPVPFNPPPKVVKTGPYRYARNPMLTGVFLFLFGVGFGVNSVSLVFFFTPLFVLINVWELKKIEEPELMKRLGDEYIDYRSQTPMFFPGLRTRSKSIVRHP